MPGLLPNADLVAARFQQIMPNLQVRKVGSTANPVFHFIQEDAPIELAETIGEFMATL